MATVTTPIMTDATGQSIDSKLNSLLGKMDNLAAAFQPNASGIAYSNTTSGLTGDDVQEAIDEMAADVSEIKQSLSNLGIVCESIVNNETITSTETTYNTYNGRKFSDYSVLIFIMKYTDTDMRASMTIPQNMWKSGGMIPLKALHGSTASGASTYNVGGMTFIYNSDTKINMFTNGTNTFSVASVVGVKLR